MAAFTFPVEIWLLILEQLCPHCHCYEMPDLRLHEHRQDISALWALSITCRFMHEVCTPSLYHCFYSTPTQDRASKFLRTLISHPELGHHVRLLSLPEMFKKFIDTLLDRFGPQSSPTKDREEQEMVPREEAQAWINLSVNFGVRVPHTMTKAMSRGTLDEDVIIPRKIQPTLRDWFHVLIIRLCPRVTHLELPFISGPGYQGKAPPALHRLQVLSCKSVLSAQKNLPWFLSDAPVMEHLIANSIDFRNGVAPVTNIRRLSVVISVPDLSGILDICPHLEDVEINLLPTGFYYYNINPENPWLNVRWPASIKRQLKRLVWSNAELMSEELLEEDLLIVPPIKDMESLEILDIDRSALYVTVKRGLHRNATMEEIGSQLPTILPASLRILRTSFGPEPLQLGPIVNELHALALAKKTFLRNISKVQIGEDPLRGLNSLSLEDLLEPKGVPEVMQVAGIELSIESNFSGRTPSYSTGILPRRPGSILYPYHTIEPHEFVWTNYW